MAVSLHHRAKRKKEKELLHMLGGHTKKWRERLKEIRQKIREEKDIIQEKYERKIKHYTNTQARLKEEINTPVSSERPVAPTIPPRYLGEYSSLSIFGTPEDMREKEDPLGPFITSGNIKLTPNEKKLLSKDPKFSLQYSPEDMSLSTEIERMNSKVRYDLGSRKKEKKKKKGERINMTDKANIELSKLPQKGTSDQGDISKELMEAFKEARDSHIYDPLAEVITFAHRKPTDYKLNKRVILPKPLDSEKEFQCELRRLEYMKALDEYKQEMKERKNNMSNSKKRFSNFSIKRRHHGQDKGEILSTGPHKDKKEEEKMKKLHPAKQERKKRQDMKSKRPTNLSRSEADAIMSLKKKIKSGTINNKPD